MRHSLASVILRLLGSRLVHEESSLLKREVDSSTEAASGTTLDSSAEGLFDRLLLVLHGLLSTHPPSWLRLKSGSKTINEPARDFSGVDRDLLETLQNDLDRMQLPDTIRWHIQAAMPVFFPSVRCSFSCQPPPILPSALSCLQPSFTNPSTAPQRNQVPLSRIATNASGKSKQQQDNNDLEVDPWTLLEDGAGSCPSASNNASIGTGDPANIKAASWLKGAVRVRRTDLTYVGPVDDDS
ncbi:hypothetical protein PIB30_117420 [Stylosanthes scabra]|uniref:Uncharacterized protein n=1 Tax=Stylosanthes scabra TaxID=79078 RepID=A0ABU6UHJ0_9FABA|nr:hypothetical protein [Stylosanthes scabra]